MTGKEAVVICVDRSSSMISHSPLVREGVLRLFIAKMIQSKQNEVGLVLVGEPREDTENHLYTKCCEEGEHDQYLGIIEKEKLSLPNAETLRRVSRALAAPTSGDESRAREASDFIDALIIAHNMLVVRTRGGKLRFSRRVYYLTNAKSGVEDVEQLKDVANMYKTHKIETSLYIVLYGDAAIELHSGVSEGYGTVRVMKSMANALGGLAISGEELSEFLGRANKVVKPMLTKVTLSVGSKLKINCDMYTRTMRKHFPPLKKECRIEGDAAGEGHEVKRTLCYFWPDNPEIEVSPFECDRAYLYGRELVPIQLPEEHFIQLKLEDEGGANTPQLKLLGFVPRSDLHLHQFMGPTFVIVGQRTTDYIDPNALQISGLAQALKQKNKGGIVRYIRTTKEKQKPKPRIGCLIPELRSEGSPQDCLLLHLLPFREDMRDYTFPSFNGSPVNPSEEQISSTSALIDAMMITSGPAEDLPLHPSIERLNTAVLLRVIDQLSPLPDYFSEPADTISPSLTLLQSASKEIEQYAKCFPLEANIGKKSVAEQQHKKRGFFWSDVLTEEQRGEDDEQQKKAREDTTDVMMP
eukprot:74163_1